MARLDITTGPDRLLVSVTLSRRNLLALLHKLERPAPFRNLESGDCWINGKQAAYPQVQLELRCEEDAEHYARRDLPPGPMNPDTEAFIAGSDG
jgi:hypothetical protein